jgi:uncharacterized membrane protein YdjX (TVP38/TMEM64 family)
VTARGDRLVPRHILRGVLFLVTLAAIGLAVERTELSGLLDADWIDREVRGKGLAGELLFVAVGAVFTGVGLPRQAISFLAGYAFGLVTGSLLALLATVAGCVGAFLYARLLGRAVVAARFSGRIRKADAFLRDNPLSMTLLIRLLPVGSNLATNLVAGVSSVHAVPFVAGSALGFVPQTVIFALAGSGVALDPEFRITLAVLLFVASALIGTYLYRRFRRGLSFANGLDEEAGEAPAGDDASDSRARPNNF